MNTGVELYEEAIEILKSAGNGCFDDASSAFLEWLAAKEVPYELLELFRHAAPKSEAWVGAGGLFDETRIMAWNDNWPEAIGSGLLIVGSAANGDHIVIDLRDGRTGYLCHEANWQREGARKWYASVAESFGQFVLQSNLPGSRIAADYFEAADAQK